MTLTRAATRYLSFVLVAFALTTTPGNVVPGEPRDPCFTVGSFPYSCHYVFNEEIEAKTLHLVSMPASVFYANKLLADNGVTPLPWPHAMQLNVVSFAAANAEPGLTTRWSGLTSLGKLQGEYTRTTCGHICFTEHMTETIGLQQVQVSLNSIGSAKRYEVVLYDGDQRCQVTITIVVRGQDESEVASSFYCGLAFGLDSSSGQPLEATAH